MAEFKACRTCKHYHSDWGSVCDHPALRPWDPVDGFKYAYPVSERKAGACGPNGDLHEPRKSLLARFLAHFV